MVSVFIFSNTIPLRVGALAAAACGVGFENINCARVEHLLKITQIEAVFTPGRDSFGSASCSR
jgi:hypothetical protein